MSASWWLAIVLQMQNLFLLLYYFSALPLFFTCVALQKTKNHPDFRMVSSNIYHLGLMTNQIHRLYLGRGSLDTLRQSCFHQQPIPTSIHLLHCRLQ